MQPPPLRSAHEVNGARTCQMNTADRAAFPQASRIVRVCDAAWTSEDNNLLEKLADVIRRRTKDWQPCELNTLVEPPPRVRHGGAHVYLLFGPSVIWVDAEIKIQIEIKGLVFEPIVRISRKGHVVINLGDDLP